MAQVRLGRNSLTSGPDGIRHVSTHWCVVRPVCVILTRLLPVTVDRFQRHASKVQIWNWLECNSNACDSVQAAWPMALLLLDLF